MQTLHALFAIALVAFVGLAGCANNGTTPTPSNDTTPTPTTPASPTSPTVPVTPPVTPPTTPTIPTLPVIGNVTNFTTPSITAVYVVSLTDRVSAGGDADVCWRVEGSGTIGHTAVHFDTVSHPNATAFTEYAAGAVYPDNGPANTTSGTFALPGTFCGQIRDLNQTVYLRAHALAAGPPASQLLSAEKVVPVGTAGNITFSDGFREIAGPSGSNRVCWTVSGITGTTTHTAIHFDNVSHPNGTFADFAGGAVYPNNAAANAVNVTVPGEFCGNVTMPARGGTLYMVAHIIFNGTHYHSEERNVVSASRLSVTGGLPQLAPAGSKVQVCWRAEGLGSSPHTALHWDTTSHPNATSFADYAGGTVYPNDAASQSTVTLPGPFCGNLTMPSNGTIYFRPHAIFDGNFQDLGPEYAIRVA